MSQFNYNLSDKSDHYDSTDATKNQIIISPINSKELIASFLTTIWGQTDGCKKLCVCVCV